MTKEEMKKEEFRDKINVFLARYFKEKEYSHADEPILTHILFKKFDKYIDSELNRKMEEVKKKAYALKDTPETQELLENLEQTDNPALNGFMSGVERTLNILESLLNDKKEEEK